MKICILTYLHNSKQWLDIFLDQLFNIDYPKEDLFYLFTESDSEDGTVERLRERTNSIINKEIFTYSIKNYAYSCHYDKLAFVHDEAFKRVSNLDFEYEYIFSIDSDVLTIDEKILKTLINDINSFNDSKLGGIAPMCCREGSGEPPVFYDWGGFMINHKNFNFGGHFPYFPGFQFNKIYKIDSMGMCFLIKKEILPLDFFHPDLGKINGFGAPLIHWAVAFERLKSKFNFYLDSGIRVYHMDPIQRGFIRTAQNTR